MVILLLAGLARAACSADVVEWIEAIDAAEDAILRGDEHDVPDLDAIARCLDEAPPPAVVARWARTRAAEEITRGGEATPWVDTALRLEPSVAWDGLAVPPLHPLRAHWAGQAELPRPMGRRVRLRPAASAWVDGERVQNEVIVGPGWHLVQRLDADGARSAVVRGAGLPGWLAERSATCARVGDDGSCALGPHLGLSLVGGLDVEGPTARVRVSLGIGTGDRDRRVWLGALLDAWEAPEIGALVRVRVDRWGAVLAPTVHARTGVGRARLAGSAYFGPGRGQVVDLGISAGVGAPPRLELALGVLTGSRR